MPKTKWARVQGWQGKDVGTDLIICRGRWTSSKYLKDRKQTLSSIDCLVWHLKRCQRKNLKPSLGIRVWGSWTEMKTTISHTLGLDLCITSQPKIAPSVRLQPAFFLKPLFYNLLISKQWIKCLSFNWYDLFIHISANKSHLEQLSLLRKERKVVVAQSPLFVHHWPAPPKPLASIIENLQVTKWKD